MGKEKVSRALKGIVGSSTGFEEPCFFNSLSVLTARRVARAVRAA